MYPMVLGLVLTLPGATVAVKGLRQPNDQPRSLIDDLCRAGYALGLLHRVPPAGDGYAADSGVSARRLCAYRRSGVHVARLSCFLNLA